MIEKFIKWGMFSVAIALTPLLFHFFCLMLKGASPSIVAITSKGELLLISVCMGAAAIGEVIISDTNNKMLKIVSGGSCIILLLISALLFAFISQNNSNIIALNDSVISNISLYLYAFSLLTNGCCLYISGETR